MHSSCLVPVHVSVAPLKKATAAFQGRFSNSINRPLVLIFLPHYSPTTTLPSHLIIRSDMTGLTATTLTVYCDVDADTQVLLPVNAAGDFLILSASTKIYRRDCLHHLHAAYTIVPFEVMAGLANNSVFRTVPINGPVAVAD